MLSPELIKKIKHIQLKAGYQATEILAGEYSSVFKGVGIEFDEVREYLPGDDVRTIDWNVTARMSHPFVKVFREEREMTLILMVDVSPSQIFGTTGRSKREVAAELAAVLAFLAIKSHDKVGLIIFSNEVELYIPPKKGRAHIWRIIREVLTHEPKKEFHREPGQPGTVTDLNSVLDYMLKVTKRKSTCFLISDFFTDHFEKTLRLAANRHDVVCVRVEDRRELELVPIGFAEFEDSETGERFILDTSDESVRTLFKNTHNNDKKEERELFKRCKIGHFTIGTGDDQVVSPLITFLRERNRRLKVSHKGVK